MNHETALIEAQLWAFEERFLYVVCCLGLLMFIGFLFKISKQ